jgi:hypothetical protein
MPQVKAKKTLFILTLIATLTTSTLAHGWTPFGSEDKSPPPGEAVNGVINTALREDDEAAKQAALKILRDRMVPALALVESYIQEGRATEATHEAKNILDDVFVISGIDPEAKLRENFLVPTVFNPQVTEFAQLSPAQQHTVIQTVKSFRGGLYLSILNLTKLVTLKWIKALYLNFTQAPPFLENDRLFILNSLSQASMIPIPVQDRNGKVIIVYDVDVTQPTHSVTFDREIFLFILKTPKLKIDEAGFKEYRSRFMGLKQPTPPAEESDVASMATSCMNHANEMSMGSSDQAIARNHCFNKFYKKFANFDMCAKFANMMSMGSSDQAVAKNSCFSNFNR